jgi:hypothetical protein
MQLRHAKEPSMSGLMGGPNLSRCTLVPARLEARSICGGFEDWLRVAHHYRWACLLAIMLGWIAYAPLWKTYFFADDVDFFGGMCVSIKDGRFTQWLWLPANSHICVLPKLAYYAVWRWLGRDVFWWHVMTLTLWSVALVALASFFLRVFDSRTMSIGLLAVFACSGGYRSQIMDPPSAVHLSSACATVWALWAAVQFLEGKRSGYLALSAAMALISYLSVAMGFLTFVFLIGLALLFDACASRRRAALAVVGSAGALSALSVQLFVGGHQPRPDVLFGLQQTLVGLSHLSGSLLGPFDLSRVLVFAMLVLMVFYWRRLNRRLLLLSLMLMILPILFACSFRADSPGIGKSSRYALVPTIGAVLWLGQMVLLTSSVRLPDWCTTRQAAMAFCGLLVGLAAHTAAQNMHVKTHRSEELCRLEEQIGMVVQAYAEQRSDELVLIPSRVITLPISPDRRGLDYVARYSVSPWLSHRIVGVESNDEFDAFLRQGWPGLAGRLVVSEAPCQ